jgi:hypothetical protein
MFAGALFALVTLQGAVDEAFTGVRGAAVVIDVVSGKVLAAHNRGAAQDERAAPGSAAKPLAMAGLIRTGTWTAPPPAVCERVLDVNGKRLDCSHPPLPGAVDAAGALAFSCNSYFAAMGTRAGATAVAGALAGFGLTVAPSAGDARLLALGESGVRASAMDLARAYAKLAALRKDARYAMVWKGMVDSVEVGTGQLAAVPGLTIAGKTGTTATHAWFVGLAPAEHPEIAVAIMARHGRGGGTAAPVAGRILGAWASQGVRGRTVNVQHRRVPLEEYVAGVLAGEGIQVPETEALKSFAVLARTFAVGNTGRHTREGYDMCAGTHCQLYRPRAVTQKARAIAAATEGEILWHEGRPAQIFYHQHCGGTTEAAETLWPSMRRPYLISLSDTFCVARGRPAWRAAVAARELAVSERSESGRVRQVRRDGAVIGFDKFQAETGSRVRSAMFAIRGGGGRFEIVGYGAGHGVGLCHAGAIERARSGHLYGQIVGFYFPGTKLGISAQAMPWVRRGGERVELWTVDAGRDEAIVGAAERALREAEERFGAGLNGRPVVRVYPGVVVFRDATGEPGWVVASTVGRTVRIRREGVSALMHEFLHMLVEERARRPLPDWFREGLVLYLENPSAVGEAGAGSVRNPGSEAEMRAAYREARRRVAGLVERFGRAAVVAWLDSGLPAGVEEPAAIR